MRPWASVAVALACTVSQGSVAHDPARGRDVPSPPMLYDGVHLQPESGNDAAGRALRQTMDRVYFALRDTSVLW